jgi:hypothetical protein
LAISPGPQAGFGGEQDDQPVPDRMPGATGKDQEVIEVSC